MKLRILDNSIRLRLAKGEVLQLQEKGEVKAETNFGKNALVYRIVRSDDATMRADFSDRQISILIPSPEVEKWATSEIVGMRGSIELADDKFLSILVEKDFKCLTDRPSEDESGLFENPNHQHRD